MHNNQLRDKSVNVQRLQAAAARREAVWRAREEAKRRRKQATQGNTTNGSA